MSDTTQANPESQTTDVRSPYIGYILLCAVVFAVTWLAAWGWLNRGLITDLFYQSSLARYQVASGEAGPATFFVFHNDFKALETISQKEESILGIELTEYKGVAAMAFTSIDVASVDLIRQHPAVRNMLQKDIPMMCH